MQLDIALLAAVSFPAAFINGVLGHGFSSLTVPITLMLFTNRVLNPVMVMAEVLLNIYNVIVNFRTIPKIIRRIRFMSIGLIPGIALGSFLLSRVNFDWVKLATYFTLLILLECQLREIRKPISIETGRGIWAGSGIGILYSLTTISGPPLALILSNEGLSPTEFRGAIAVIRTLEALLTAFTYYRLGLFTQQSLQLELTILPSLFIGVLLGSLFLKRIDPLHFKSMILNFDFCVVGFGLIQMLVKMKYFSQSAGITLFGTLLLYEIFRFKKNPAPEVSYIPEKKLRHG